MAENNNPQTEPSIQAPGSSDMVEELKKSLEEKDARIEELEAKIESLQESLDSALEEMALKGSLPEAEAGEEEEESEFSESEPEAKESEAPGEEVVDIEAELEKAIRDDAAFREEILMREEMRDLREELDAALAKYPEADADEILLGIEDGLEEDNPNQVEALAKASHERRIAEKEALRKEIEESLRAKLIKEAEGGISIPQSPGTPPTPQTPQMPPSGATSTPALSVDEEWNEALRRAKVEGGGV